MNVTDFTSIRASAVPAVPKEVTATQRLAMLNLASDIAELRSMSNINGYVEALLYAAEKMLREVAS